MKAKDFRDGSTPLLAFKNDERGWKQSMDIAMLYPNSWTATIKDAPEWFYLFVKGYERDESTVKRVHDYNI